MSAPVGHWSRDDRDYDDEFCDDASSSSKSPSCCCGCCCCCGRGGYSSAAACRELDIHGMRRIWLPQRHGGSATPTASQTLRRTAWVVLLLLMLGAFVYTAADRVFVFLSEPHFTRYSSSDTSRSVTPSPLLPGITVCNLNPLRLTELVRRKWPTVSRDVPPVQSASEQPDGDSLSSSWVNMSSWELYTSAGPRIEKLLLSCSAGAVKCSSLNFTRSILDSGVCFTIYPNATRLRLILNAESYEYPAESGPDLEGIGVRLLIHSSERPPPPGYSHPSGIRLSAGQLSVVTVQRTDVTLVSSRARPCSDESDLDDCVTACQADEIIALCGCRPFWAATSDGRAKICSAIQHLTCVLAAADNYGGSSSVYCSCREPCRQRLYVWETSHTQFPPQRSPSLPHPATRLLTPAQLAEFNEDRCRAAGVRWRAASELWREDTRELGELERAVDDLAHQVERAQAELRQTAHELHASLTSLHPRLSFHADVGLAGVRAAFLQGFARAFESVRERSLHPLVADPFETVSSMERAVKQLQFAPAGETVNRKVLYYTADNELSGRLEIAIQALDNLTKVYYSFIEAKPFYAYSLTPEGRYDQHLVPEELLMRARGTAKEHYTGISESIAGLMEDILQLKEVVRGVYDRQAGGLNESLFDSARRGYARRTALIERYTASFQSDVIARTTAALDSRLEEMRGLNASLVVAERAIFEGFTRVVNIFNSRYAEAYNTFRKFTQLAQSYLRDPSVQKLSLTALGLDPSISLAVKRLTSLLDDVMAINAALRADWHSLEGATRSVWERILRETILRNFYLNLYNDVTDMVNYPQRAEAFRTVFLHAKLLGRVTPRPSFSSTGGDAGVALGEGAGSRRWEGRNLVPGDFYALLNADQPIISVDVKLANVSERFARYVADTDLGAILGARWASFTGAYDVMRRNLERFETQCVVNAELFSENVVIADVQISSTVFLREDAPSYSLFTLLSELGGLLALSLGASVVTLLELADVVLHCACARRSGPATTKRPPIARKSPDSNHVTFKAVDTSDVISADGNTWQMTSLPMTSSAMTSSASQPTQRTPNRVPPPVGHNRKIKVDAGYRSKHGLRQAETDI